MNSVMVSAVTTANLCNNLTRLFHMVPHFIVIVLAPVCKQQKLYQHAIMKHALAQQHTASALAIVAMPQWEQAVHRECCDSASLQSKLFHALSAALLNSVNRLLVPGIARWNAGHLPGLTMCGYTVATARAVVIAVPTQPPMNTTATRTA
jgi:hypothetical protein